MQKKNVVGVSNPVKRLVRPTCNLSILAILVLAAGVLLNAQQTLPKLAPPGGAMGGGGTSKSGSVPGKGGGGLSKAGGGGSAGGVGQGIAGAMSVGSLTDAPIFAGETVHVLVFDAPDFSIVGQVSDGGDIALPMAGVVHIAGLNSQTAGQLIADRLRSLDLLTSPQVAVTVDTQALGITVLGEVRSPGIYQLSGKSMLSDLLAMAGGVSSDSGRVLEISNANSPDKKTDLPWDPTLHNTANFDLPVHPGDRIIIKPCGIAYVGGNVGKPGAYPLCASQITTLSEIVAMAGGVSRFTSESRTYIIRNKPDGTRVVIQVNIDRIQRAKAADVSIQEDDIVYVTPSSIKLVATQAMAWAVSLGGPLIYNFH